MLLYLDMDGVLMDYDRHCAARGLNWKGRLYYSLPENQWTPEELANDEHYKAAMADPTFWRTMEPMKDAHMLWGWATGLGHHVLTATPNKATYHERCAIDKLHTLHRWFDPTFPADRFTACQRSDKAKFARGNVLVDDNEHNCKEWCEAGGTAILHKDAESSIRMLREIMGHD